MKLCVTYIVTGKYHTFFNDFYRSFKKNFCKNHDVTYFVYTDNVQMYQDRIGCDIDLDCMFFPINPCSESADFNKFRKFKFLLGAEELYCNFDYIFYMNGNLTCHHEVDLNELFQGKEQYAVVHSLFDRKTNPMYQSLTKKKESSAWFDVSTYPKYMYFQSGNIGCTRQRFVDLCNYIECARSFDAYYKLSKYIPWHDETYYNKYINTLIKKDSKSINVLDGKNWLCTWLPQLKPFVNSSKMLLIDKDHRWHELKNQAKKQS